MMPFEVLANPSHLLMHPPVPIGESSPLTPWVKGSANMVGVARASARKASHKPACSSPKGELG